MKWTWILRPRGCTTPAVHWALHTTSHDAIPWIDTLVSVCYSLYIQKKNLAWFCFVFRLTFLSLAQFLCKLKLIGNMFICYNETTIYYACTVFVPIMRWPFLLDLIGFSLTLNQINLINLSVSAIKN
jgi:hypothetical protein